MRQTGTALMIFGLAAALLAAAWLTRPVAAAQVARPAPQADAPKNEMCLACHAQQAMQIPLESGETLSLYVNGESFKTSAHGAKEVACAACHSDITTFPHPERKAKSLREVTTQFSQTCQQCHADENGKTMQSVHQAARDSGNLNAAACADCHNPHATRPVAEMTKAETAATCAQCHNAIYETYKTSVHGSALIGEGNLDVATCTDCHGVHDIQNPTTTQFRNETPKLCAKCHTDPAIMDKYGLSTQVYSTYVADFHGATVTLFETTDPSLPTNKAVCTDCHGIHDISRVNDPATGITIKKNLLVKCQQCHPGLNENFPDAWMGHYIASPTKYPIVYYVNLFYQILIPTVLGGMAIFVISDFARRMIDRRKGKNHA
ncbi:MAG: hypothetical protein Fur0035_24300 [Anaerolineales bacterium]